MESYRIENLTFSYPQGGRKVIDNINISIGQGEFVTLCGPSGCGKTTLLRQLKPILAPHGEKEGEIFFEGDPLASLDHRTQTSKIGFVMQSPDNQIVTDKVWHELAFGLESLGFASPTIRLRVAEMASFFGIENWFYRDVTELSGGQKQLLNLAAVMVMHPSVLILDEPTSQLDPIASAEFISVIERINRELATSIIITEHRLEEVFPLSDRVLVMDGGQIICDGLPRDVGKKLREMQHSMFHAMPTPMRIYAGVENNLPWPVTVREGRKWLDAFSEQEPLGKIPPADNYGSNEQKLEPIVEVNNVYFRYDRQGPDIIKNLSMKIFPGEFYAILGGNGTGKTTALSLITGINKPYRGAIKINGKDLSKMDKQKLFNNFLALLPQNPQSLFVGKTVKDDLMEVFSGQNKAKEEKEERVGQVAKLCDIEQFLSTHPYDLSGGEQQRAALAKILLLQPKILILDEPTKGMDAGFKQVFAKILNQHLENGGTIIMVSHDIEFCATYAQRCAMFFDGNIVSLGRSREFFSNNSFYTTSANRMARHKLPDAIRAQDVILACGGDIQSFETQAPDRINLEDSSVGDWEVLIKNKQERPNLSLNSIPYPQNNDREKRHLSKRTLLAMMIILIAIPLTIYMGIYYLDDRKYYFISMLIILEILLPFVMIFEGRKPQARELIIIAVLCAISVAGRTAFYMLPQFKPVVAIVIIAGVAFGGETGFLVGAVTGFVSNIFIGQGPWTPWQMFAFGIIGFMAGVLFKKGLLMRDTLALCIFGGLATFFIYGGIMNPASVLMFQAKPTREMLYLAYIQGIPFDLVHSGATMVFLYFTAKPMLEKLDRVKLKFGLIEN